MQSAAKVGALVLGFAVLLVLAFNFLGQSLFQKPSVRYLVTLDDATGLQSGSAVLLAGVPVGRIDRLRLEGTRPVAEISLTEPVAIPEGTIALIPGSLIGLGETPLSLELPKRAGAALPPGSTIPGRKQGPLEKILPDSEATMKELTATMAAVRKLLSDPELIQGTKNLMASGDKTLQAAAGLASRMDRLMAQNEAKLALAMDDINRTLANVESMTARFDQLAKDPKIEGDLRGMLADMRSTVKRVDGLMADLSRTLNDPAIQGPVKTSLGNVAEMTERGKGITANVEEMTKNGVQVSQRAVVLSDKAIEIADKASNLADGLDRLIKRFDGLLGGKGGPTALSRLETEATLTRETSPNKWRTDFNAMLPISGRRIHLGIYDAFESNGLNLQLGQPVGNRAEFRYGVYGSKPGLGVDYAFASKWQIRGDLWDLNNPRLDLRTRYDLGNGIYGWIGLERIFEENSLGIGLSIRR